MKKLMFLLVIVVLLAMPMAVLAQSIDDNTGTAPGDHGVTWSAVGPNADDTSPLEQNIISAAGQVIDVYPAGNTYSVVIENQTGDVGP